MLWKTEVTLCVAAQATAQKGARGPWVQVGPRTAPSQAPEECERQLCLEGRGTPEGAGSQALHLPEKGSDSRIQQWSHEGGGIGFWP